ncbi:hypothetical protein LguiA_014891 [Lonicera macranthoides]
MAFNQTLKIFALILFFLLPLISFTCPSPPSSTKVQQANAPPNLFYIKNTTPIFLDKQALNNNVKKKRMRIKRKKNHHRLDSRAFSAMLPKGFVPPSGSSPCHNDHPNSVTFFCELSKEIKP